MSRTSKSSRRDFLIGKSAIDAISRLPSQLGADPGSGSEGGRSGETPTGNASYLIQVGRPAMACQFEVFLNAGQHSDAVEAAIQTLDRVEALEAQLTVYRAHSEVSRLNATAALRPVVVETGLFQLLQLGCALQQETEGAFDMTAGPLSKVWGFHRRQGKLPEAEAVEDALALVGSQRIVLDSQNKSVQFESDGMEINLGAIGKGYALDEASRVLEAAGVDDFLIHGGQSTVLGRGTRLSQQARGPGWCVGLRHPLKHDRQLAEVWLQDKALATSGSGNQFFHFQGKRYGHVLDPRTGYPVDQVLSATVLAPSATLADALSTAFYVMGVEAAAEYCNRYPHVSAIFMSAGRRAGSLSVQTIGIEDADWRLLGESE